MAGETLLVISGIGVPPFSARGLTQTLEPIAAAANVRRTVNGALVNLAPTQFQKYRSRISCTDMASPAVDGVFPGLTVTVDCVAELAYLTSGGSPQRTIVSGSSYIDGSFTFYRPRLTKKIVGFSISTDEYGAAVAWTMDLEED